MAADRGPSADAPAATSDAAAGPQHRKVPDPGAKPKKSALKKTSKSAEGGGQGEEDGQGDPLYPQATPEAVFEAKRRRAAFTAMMRLLEQGAGSEDELVRVAAPLSGDELMQVAEERWLASRCGNPLCTTAIHQPPRKQSLGKVKLSLAAGDLVVTQGPEPFCCVECEQYIRGYADLLGDPMQRLKPEVKQRLLSHGPRKAESDAVAASVNGVTTMLAHVKERDPQEAARAAAEGAAALGQAAGDAGGPAAAAGMVEGYVPRTSPAPSAHATNTAGISRSSITHLVQDVSAPTQMLLPRSSYHTTTSITADVPAGGSGKGEGEHQQLGAVQQGAAAGDTSGVSTCEPLQSQQLQQPPAPSGALKPSLSFKKKEQPPPVKKSVSFKEPDKEKELFGHYNSHPHTDPTITQPATTQPPAQGIEPASQQGGLQPAGQGPAEGLPPGAPMLVFSLEGEGANTEGVLSVAPEALLHGEGDSDDEDPPGTAQAGSSTTYPGTGKSLLEVTENEPGSQQLAGTMDLSEVADRAGLVLEQLEESTAAGGAQESAGADGTSTTSAGVPPKVPRAMRLWFPAAAGGKGVHVNSAAARQPSQPASPAAKPPPQAGASRSSPPLTAGHSGTRNGSSAMPPSTGTGTTSATAAAPAASSASSAAAAAAGSGNGGGEGNGKRRRFAPLVPGARPGTAQRRGVVLLDSPPDRVVRPSPLEKGSKLSIGAGAQGTAGSTQASATTPSSPLPAAQQQAHELSQTAASTSSSRSNKTVAKPSLSSVPQQSQAEVLPFEEEGETAGPAHVREGGVIRIHSTAPPGLRNQGMERSPDFSDAIAEAYADEIAELRRKQREQKQKQRLQGGAAQPSSSATQGTQEMGDGEEEEEEEAGVPRGTPVAHVINLQPGVPHSTSRSSRHSSHQGYGQQEGGDSDGEQGGSRYSDDDGEHRHRGSSNGSRSGTDSSDEDDEEDMATGRLLDGQLEPIGEEGDVSDQDGEYGGEDVAPDDFQEEGAQEGGSQPSKGKQPSGGDNKRKGVQGGSNKVESSGKGRHTSSAQGGQDQEDEADAPYVDEDEEDDDAGSGYASSAASDVDPNYMSAAPFFGPPPKSYRLELSPFNQLWSLLGSWVTRATIAYVHAPPHAPALSLPPIAEAPAGDMSEGQETAHGSSSHAAAASDSDAAGQVLSALPAPGMRDTQARAALATQLDRHMIEACRVLRVRTPASDVNARLTGLLRTLAFPAPLPTLSEGQLRLLAVAMLRALSVSRLPAVAHCYERPAPAGQGPTPLAQLLDGTGFSLPHLSALLDLLMYD